MSPIQTLPPTQPTTMYDILKDPERLRGDVMRPTEKLAYLWRTLLMQRGIGLPQFDQLIATYIQKARKDETDLRAVNYINRGSLYRELSKPEMNWDSFLRGLQILGAQAAHVDVLIDFKAGESDTCMFTADLREGAVLPNRFMEETAF